MHESLNEAMFCALQVALHMHNSEAISSALQGPVRAVHILAFVWNCLHVWSWCGLLLLAFAFAPAFQMCFALLASLPDDDF
jgi:hypothetical protein